MLTRCPFSTPLVKCVAIGILRREAGDVEADAVPLSRRVLA
jgi:hypothetical protein